MSIVVHRRALRYEKSTSLTNINPGPAKYNKTNKTKEFYHVN